MSQRSRTSLPRSMGVVGLTLFGISYMAIGTVFTTYGIVNQLTEGHLVASYAVALIVMLFTASSYAAMVRRYPVAGSAYTYAQQSFGGSVGFLTGWILLLDYLFIPMINFLILGLYANTQFPDVPVWVFTLGAIIVALILNVLGISLVSKVNTAVVLISFAAVVVFAFFAIKTAIGDPNAPGVLEPFLPGSAQFSPVLTGAAVLSLSFLGFDAVSTLSEEAKRPRRDIPIAIMVTTIVGGLLFIAVAWVGALAYHLSDWSTAPQALLDAAGAVLFDHVGGPILAGTFVFVTVIGTLGAGLAGQAAVSRILFSMGRDGILPRPLGGLSKKYGTPVVATAVVSVVALAGLFVTLAQAAFMISFGALVAFAMVNLSVIRTYLFPPRAERRALTAGRLMRYGIVPAIGFALTLWLLSSLEGGTWVIGGIWALLGVVILAIKTGMFRRPVPKLDFSEVEPTTEAIDQLPRESFLGQK
ncbi:Putrescine importer PuuP [Microbacterium testaceum]|uniref:APC family permease n=1 Tax=Microbacterium testaceum TaxID=2033 RepID=UPI00073485FF|nr:APC family permease [Microbacterium testaceum]KTS70404.1 Putrescine importer PuuP [Microbacterium testaceum]